MNAPAISVDVSKRFHALRRRHLFVRLCIALTTAAMALLVMWIALAAIDYLWELRLAWREGIGRAGAAIVFLLLARSIYLIIRESRQRKFAAKLEASFAEFGQRIRTVLDTVEGRVSGPAAMLSALGHQTLGRWEISAPGRIVPSRMLLTCCGTCLLAFLFAAGLFHSGDDWRSAMLRAIGYDVPYTSLTVTPGNATVLEGQPVEVSLVLEGRTNRDVTLRYRELPNVHGDKESSDDAEASWIESELLPQEMTRRETRDPRSARFAAGLGKASAPVEYQFISGAETTPIFRLDVKPLIEARRVEATVEPPKYTRLNSRSFTSTDVTVLEGSKVSVTVETNHPLHKASLNVGTKPSKMDSVDVAVGKEGFVWDFELPSAESLYWTFSGTGQDGTPMAPIKGRLRVRRDAAPNLAWRDPANEIRVHTLAELPMRLQVSDDYGVSETAIIFQLGGGDEYVLTDWVAEETADEAAATTTRLRLEEVLPLESFALSERDYISYYAYAVDNRSPGAHRSESDLRFIDVRPLRQYYSELERDEQLGAGGRVLVQLDEIIRRQRFLINRTRKLVRGSAVELSDQLGVIDRMVENQSELAGLARFLAEFFVSRGNDDVEALNQAEAAMLQAADSLAAAQFELAFAQEEDALRALVEARRTIEIVLPKNNSPQQRQAMQRLARQLRQKLRRDRPENEQEIADSLMQISSLQLQLGETAAAISSKQASGGGASEGEKAAEPETRSIEEQQNELFSEQVDLIERLQAIEEQLAERLAGSELMSRRMGDAKAAMNELATAARDGEFGDFSNQSRDTGEHVRELALQLQAIAATEAVMRVSAIRDMATSLANMERDLAEQLKTRSLEASSANGNAESGGDEVRRLARRLQRRAETTKDIFNAPVEVGDLETSEVNDRLQTFAEENAFLEQLERTLEVSKDLSRDAPTATEHSSELAYDRAVEYAEAANQLDDLYRRLLSPRLERLRELEARANKLAQQSGASGEAAEEPTDPATKANISELKQDLEEEGLSELAKLIDVDATVDDEGESIELLGSEVIEDRFAPTSQLGSGGLVLVVKELRARIQQIILLEISADRDAPVPPQYRTAVDRYLRVIAGEAEAPGSSGANPAEPADGGTGS